MRWSELKEGDSVHSGAESYLLVAKSAGWDWWLCLNTGRRFEQATLATPIACWWRVVKGSK